MSFFIAIDCGTTSTRVIAYNKELKVHCIHQAPLDLNTPSPQWVEQSANEIWIKTKYCLDQVIQDVGVEKIQNIGLTNQRETSVIWEKSTIFAKGPAINWQCRRTQYRCKELANYQIEIKERTGLPIDPYFSATKIEWLIKNANKIDPNFNITNYCMGTVDTWLIYNLTQGDVYATDVTNASRTMLFNINTTQFDPFLCSLFNIPIDQLASVKMSHDDYGHYSYNGKTIPITGVIGDQQAALFAQCNRKNNVIKNTYGTGLFMMSNTANAIVKTKDLVTTIAVGLNGEIDYGLEGSVFTGGALLKWLRDNLMLFTNIEDTEKIAQEVPNNGGVTIIPALSGLGAPYWQPNATGIITGLTHQTTSAHIIRASLEAIALQSHDIIQLFKQACPNINFDQLFVDGGASQNNWLVQLQADLCQCEILRPESIEATALGATLVANSATDFSNCASKIDRFKPDKEPITLSTQWKNAIQLIKTD